MSIRTARRIAARLAFPAPVTRVEYLRAGYSPDRKYLLHTDDGPRWLLRICPGRLESSRREGFELLGRLHARGVACPEPIHFGNEGDSCYYVVSYLDSECVEDALPRLSEVDQHSLGVQAGVQLRRIQSSLSPDEPVDWPGMRRARYDEHSATCRELGLTFHRQDEARAYVEANFHRLLNRPITILHGDYHPGNMICCGSSLTGVVDFDRYRWGDPWFEFHRVGLITVTQSPAFARGQVEGYFEGRQPPPEFWPLYNLYLALILPADLVWVSRNYPKWLPRNLRLTHRIVETHDFAGGGPPAWYEGA